MLAGRDMEQQLTEVQLELDKEKKMSNKLQKDNEKHVSEKSALIADIEAKEQELHNKEQELYIIKDTLQFLEEGYKELQQDNEKHVSEKNALITDIEAKERELHNKDQELHIIKDTLQFLEENYKKLQQDFKNSKGQTKCIQKKFDNLTERFNIQKDNLKSSEATKKKLEKQNTSLENKLQTAEVARDTLKDKVALLETSNASKGTLKEKEEEIARMKEEYSQLNGNISDLEKELSSKKERLSANQEEIKVLQSKIESLEQELLKKSETVSQDEIREMETHIQQSEETINEKNTEIARLKSDIKNRDTERNAIISELNQLRQNIDDQKETYQSQESQINRLKNENALLRQDVAEKNKEIKRLSQEKEESVKVASELIKEQHLGGNDKFKKNRDTTEIEETKTDKVLVESKKQPQEDTIDRPIVKDKKPHLPTVSDQYIPEIAQGTSKSKLTCPPHEEPIIKNGIQDFPPIVNDSIKSVHRTIEVVIDNEKHTIKADEFFTQSSPEEIARMARLLAEAAIKGQTLWSCKNCGTPIKIGRRQINGNESLFFTHTTHNAVCPWIQKSTKSQDKLPMVDDVDETEEQEPLGADLVVINKPQELKNTIMELLSTNESKAKGVGDVKMDAIVKSSFPYMRWRRPDISFTYGKRKVVIQLQRKKHSATEIADRDIFYRLNDTQVIWIFGADSDVSYNYLRQINYKNTLFFNHRNVLIFDKEAQEESKRQNTLVMKCNWLDEDDNWNFRLEKNGTNGRFVTLFDLIYDDEYCKPYAFEANEPYFAKYPESKNDFEKSLESREDLLKALEENWKREQNYIEAQRTMRHRHAKAEPFKVGNTWGVRFNYVTLIQPIFTEPPVDIGSYYSVKLGESVGLVNCYAERVIDWNGIFRKPIIAYFNVHQLVVFDEGNKRGIADKKGNVIIPAIYDEITFWSQNTFKVKANNKWTICDLSGKSLTTYWYDSIDPYNKERTAATMSHEDSWKIYNGFIDDKGNPIITSKLKLSDDYEAVKIFELWGISQNGQIIIEPKYGDIVPWYGTRVRVCKENKWGVIDINGEKEIIPLNYDYIGELIDGVAETKTLDVIKLIDIDGEEVLQESINLIDGYQKIKKSGKYGFVDDSGNEIIAPIYDEIGSFRGRLIGIINGRVIKLNAYYNYPIMLTANSLHYSEKAYIYDIGNVNCSLSRSIVSSNDYSTIELMKAGDIGLAFGNLLFSKKRYLLRVVKSEQLTKPLSHGDKDSDFELNRVYDATITGFKTYKYKNGTKKTTKASISLSNDKKSMIPARFFKTANHSITDFAAGDSLRIRKIGFDDELDQTIWEIINDGSSRND